MSDPNLPPGCTQDEVDEAAREQTWRTSAEEREEMEMEKAEAANDLEEGK